MLPSWEYAGAFWLFIEGIALLVADDWRWVTVHLAVMYAVAASLLTISWPLSTSATLLVGGWMAASVLAVSQHVAGKEPERGRLSAAAFRFLAGLLVAPLAVSLMPALMSWLPPMHPAQLWGGVALIGLGLWRLGLRSGDPFHVTVSLLTVLAGFELIEAALENSLLLAGLLAGVVVALGLAGGYLILQTAEAEE